MRFLCVLGICILPGALPFIVSGLLADKIFFSPVERFLHRRWGTIRA